jgi:hypothetical protein
LEDDNRQDTKAPRNEYQPKMSIDLVPVAWWLIAFGNVI